MARNAEAALAVLRAQARALNESIEALAASLTGESDDLLGVTECRALGVGRDALTAAADRGELAVSRGPRGPRGKLLVRRSAIEAWLASKPYIPSKPTEPAPDLDAWAARQVRRTG